MFETLTRKIADLFQGVRAKGLLKEDDVNKALSQMRLTLLEADVALPVAKNFIAQIKEKAIGQEIIKSVNPAHMIIKIVHDELIALLSHPNISLNIQSRSTRMMLAGLQGSGKTTFASKIALWLKKKGKNVLLVSLDIYRPAAQEQLEKLALSIGVDSLPIVAKETPLAIVSRALECEKKYDVLLFDTAGRLEIDETLMQELEELHQKISPHETLFIADALSGQSLYATAQVFSQRIPLTGLGISRMDADTRGGSVLSVRASTGLPIKFLGTGERPSDLVLFDPQRIADLILDKGDIIGLVEKARQNMTQEEEEREMLRLKKGLFTLNDLIKQLERLETMGGISKIIGFLPGLSQHKEQIEEKMKTLNLNRKRALVQSMTKKERVNPAILNARRRQRIAKGAGQRVEDLNKLLQDYENMKKMMKMFSGRS